MPPNAPHDTRALDDALAVSRPPKPQRPRSRRETVIVEMHWESPENDIGEGFWRGTIGRIDPRRGTEQRLSAFDGIDQLVRRFETTMRRVFG